MPLDAATGFLERIQNDPKFRDSYIAACDEVIRVAQDKAFLTAREAGYVFTPEEYQEAQKKLILQKDKSQTGGILDPIVSLNILVVNQDVPDESLQAFNVHIGLPVVPLSSVQRGTNHLRCEVSHL